MLPFPTKVLFDANVRVLKKVMRISFAESGKDREMTTIMVFISLTN
jgi:hypothetical protein